MDNVSAKLYTKIVPSVSDGYSGIVELRDTAGSSIACNYLKVSLNGSIASPGYLYVQPSGIYSVQNINFDPSACTLGGSACGGFAVAGNETYETILPIRCTSLGLMFRLGSGTAGQRNIIITYGATTTNNPLKGFGNTGR